MKILFLLNSFNVGGYEQLMLEVFRSLQKHGHSITTCCLKEKGTLAPELEEAGIPVLSGFLSHRLDIFAPLRIRRVLKGERFDLVFMEMGRNALLVGRAIASAVGAPALISSVHGTGVPDKGGLLSWSQVKLLNRLDGVIACAETQSRHLVEQEGLDPNLVRVIVNGVDHTRFAPARGESAPAGVANNKGIATVASLTPEKGHLDFVAAAARTLEKVPDAHFYIIGDGPERPRIEEEIRKRSLEESVTMLGIRRDLPELLPHFRVVALASIPLRETLPISTMEAMSCGVPTVNTDVGSVPDLVEHGVTGYIVPPGNLDALSDAFIDLLSDPKKAETMGRAARTRVEKHFTMERALREYEEYFEQAARRTIAR